MLLTVQKRETEQRSDNNNDNSSSNNKNKSTRNEEPKEFAETQKNVFSFILCSLELKSAGYGEALPSFMNRLNTSASKFVESQKLLFSICFVYCAVHTTVCCCTDCLLFSTDTGGPSRKWPVHYKVNTRYRLQTHKIKSYTSMVFAYL